MVARILFILLLTPLFNFAQETDDKSVIKTGLLRAQATISFGKLINLKQASLYLQGNIEYYVNNTISSRGDIFYYLKSNDESLLELNHQLFAGTSYHFKTKGNFNPYIGFQPGIAITQSSEVPNIYFTKANTTLTPLLSPVIGFNYYASNWFHLFIEGRYVYGKHISNYPPLNISEVRLSFGLGFNISTK